MCEGGGAGGCRWAVFVLGVRPCVAVATRRWVAWRGCEAQAGGVLGSVLPHAAVAAQSGLVDGGLAVVCGVGESDDERKRGKGNQRNQLIRKES